MKRTHKPRHRSLSSRPQVELLESRLLPGDALGGLIGIWLLGLEARPAEDLLDSGNGFVTEPAQRGDAATPVPLFGPLMAPSVNSPEAMSGRPTSHSLSSAPTGISVSAGDSEPLADLLNASGFTDFSRGGSGAPFANDNPHPSTPSHPGENGRSFPAPGNAPVPPTPGLPFPTRGGAEEEGGATLPYDLTTSMNSYLGDWVGPSGPIPEPLQAVGDNTLPAALLPGSSRTRGANASPANVSALFDNVPSPAAAPLPPDSDPGDEGPLAVDVQEYNFGLNVFTAPGATGESAPLAGIELLARVYSPTNLDGGPRPLILLLHGRHTVSYNPVSGAPSSTVWPPAAPFTEIIPSYQGYDYLGNNLASHGYVVVSVSANGINAQDNNAFDFGTIARAQLVQRHLDILEDLTTTGTVTDIPAEFNPRPFGDRFVGKFDLQNVGTMGDSRGGEGLVRHFILNQALGSPYGIKAVLGLGPTDFNRHVINGVPLGVILPYNDGDVRDLQGIHYYDDARYNMPGDLTPKHTFYVLGANHNFFNTVWTPGQFPTPGAPPGFGGASDDGLGPLDTRLSIAQVQGLGEAYMAGFFRTYVGNTNVQATGDFVPLLKGETVPPPSAQTDQIYASYHAPDSPFLRRDVNRLANLGNLTTNNLGGAVTDGGFNIHTIYGGDPPQGGFSFPGEPSMRYPHTVPSSRSSRRGLSQLRLSYANTDQAFFRNNLPAGVRNVASFVALQFRAGTAFSLADLNNKFGVPGDFSVVLTDGDGDSASLVVGDQTRVLFYPPDLVPPSGIVGLGRLLQNTVRIPLDAFTEANGNLDLNNVTSVRFQFDQRQQGGYVFSDIAFVDRRPDLPPVILAASPAGIVNGPIGSVRVTLDQPIDSLTFTTVDVVSLTHSSGGVPVSIPVTGVTPVAGSGNTRFDISFAPQDLTGTYSLVIGPDISNASGVRVDQDNDGTPGENPDDRFSTSFQISGP